MNFGLAGLPEHDLRYDMADEYMAAVRALWNSWEPGAIRADRTSGVFIDPAKVHHADFEGQWYKTRGPLNSGPCPQGQPVIAQAGGSPRGRAFAARHADTIVAHAKGIGGMKAYRDDVRQHMAAQGRDPDACKVLFMIAPILGETEELAQEHKRRRAAQAAAQIPQRLAFFGKLINVDFAGFDLDRPICDIDITTNGHQLNLEQFKRIAGTRTLRETMADYNATSLSIELVGTPDSVAARMGEVMEEVGGDGYLFSLPNVSRRTLAEIEDGLVPALQDRGLMRKAYTFEQFRDNLLEF
jgi:FMN-dependent oxidoreductase (nitrilotriacetate monooxygenase family)